MPLSYGLPPRILEEWRCEQRGAVRHRRGEEEVFAGAERASNGIFSSTQCYSLSSSACPQRTKCVVVVSENRTMLIHRIPSFSPLSLLTLRCSQSSRSFAASFCFTISPYPSTLILPSGFRCHLHSTPPSYPPSWHSFQSRAPPPCSSVALSCHASHI